LVVYERGAGLTQACGSGACAAALALRYSQGNSLEDSFSQNLNLLGGDVKVSYVTEQHKGHNTACGELCLEGSAHYVFDATYNPLM
jgi:diaminopimelate epimerase